MLPLKNRNHPTLFIVTVTLLYFVFGYLGLKVAVLPGYSSPVFPAAGIALAFVLNYGSRVVPGVFLGSFFLNFTISLEKTFLSTPEIILLSTCIALGAALQAYLGKYFIERVIDFHKGLYRIKPSVYFLLLGGLVTCLISSTIGSFVLYCFGIVSGFNLLPNWFSWWVGDVLGVFVFTPLLIAWIAKPRTFWTRRKYLISAPLICTYAAYVILIIFLTKWHQENRKVDFKRQSEKIFLELQKGLNNEIFTLTDMRAFFIASEHVTRQEFQIFTEHLLKIHSNIQALEWVPKVPFSQLAEYEYKAIEEGLPSFMIWELGDDQKRVPVQKRTDYFPVYYVEPYTGNEAALGFDLASNSHRKRALEEARDLGVQVVTERIVLVQESSSSYGILLFDPIYHSNVKLETKEERREKLLGFTVVVFKIADLIQTILKDQSIEFIITLIDASAEKENQLLFSNNGGAYPLSPALSWKKEFPFGTRNWQLIVEPKIGYSYVSLNSPTSDWVFLTLSLLFFGLLVWFLLIITGRNIYVTRLVEERTKELKETNIHLLQATQVKSNFLANISHEIRTPMNAIMGFTEIMLKDHPTKKVKVIGKQILQSSKDLLTLINSILDLSKIEAGKLELDYTPFCLADATEQVKSLLSIQAKEKGIDFHVNVSDAIPRYLLGDAARIKQVLINLGNNAIKFTPIGSVVIKASLHSLQQSSCEVEFSVSDTGIGIAKEQRDLLFHPFSQLDASLSRELGGTGLGLAISQELVKAMGGVIQLETALNHGSTFKFTLNFSISDFVIPKKEPKKLPGKKFAVQYPFNILLAEDNELNQKLVIMLLESLGYKPDCVADGKEAIQAFKEKQYDLIFMDVHMPIVTGLQAASEIRNITRSESHPFIIALTAYAFSEDKEACLKAGMNAYISKPFSINQLIKVLKSAKKGEFVEFLTEKKVLNKEQINKLLDVNKEIAMQLLDSFLEQCTTISKELKEAVKEGNSQELEMKAHKFRGACLNLGADLLASRMKELEQRGRADNLQGLDSLFSHLKRELAMTKTSIEELQKTFRC